MPLIKCPDCEKDVSDSAAACIHCGRPLSSERSQPKKKKGPMTRNLGVGGWLFLAGIVLALYEPLRAVGGLCLLFGIALIIARLVQKG